MTAAGKAILFLALVYLQTALALVAEGHVENISQKRAPNDGSFPPEGTVEVPLQLAVSNGAVSDIFVPVTIKGKTFNMVLDTGSSVCWVVSDQLEGAQYDHLTKYPTDDHDLESCERGLVSYGDKVEVSGPFVENDLTVSGCTRRGFKFLAADQIKNDNTQFFERFKAEGVLGANAEPSNDEDIAEPWFAGTKFTVKIDQSGSSTLTFGDIDVGSVEAIDLDEDATVDWIVPSEELDAVLLDTGTVALWLFQDFIEDYLEDVTSTLPPHSEGNDSDDWFVDCDATLPDMKIDLGGQSVTIPGSRLKIPPANGNPPGKCRLRIDTVDESEEDHATLGIPFFLDHIVTFDAAKKQVFISKR